jgi:hypothetical protein
MTNSVLRLALALSLGLFVGCISVPDAILADFVDPDGKRPNNFGKTVVLPEGKIVRPDVPTIAAPKRPQATSTEAAAERKS